MKLGFTGTRDGLTVIQNDWLWELFDHLEINEVHHGACVGADLEMHRAALAHKVRVIVHPPVITKFLATECLIAHQLVTILPAKPYLNRDREIAASTDGLVGMPKNQEPQGLNLEGIGGTWYTIRYAQRLDKTVVICYPDGTIEKRRPLLRGNQ